MCESAKTVWFGAYGERVTDPETNPEISKYHVLDAAIFLTKFGLSGLAGWKFAKALPIKPWVLGSVATLYGLTVGGVEGLVFAGAVSTQTDEKINPWTRPAELGCLSVVLGVVGSWSLNSTIESMRHAILVLQSYPVRRMLRITPGVVINAAMLVGGTLAVGTFTSWKMQGDSPWNVWPNVDGTYPAPERWG